MCRTSNWSWGDDSGCSEIKCPNSPRMYPPTLTQVSCDVGNWRALNTVRAAYLCIIKGIYIYVYCIVKILLNILMVCDNFNHTVPDVVRHEVTSECDELKDDIDVPLIVGCKLLSQNGQFDDQLLTNSIISGEQVG